MRRDARTGVLYRREDKVIIDEHAYDALPVQDGDVLLDLGAHIGTTSRLALDRGAALVVAVEADPANVTMLRMNLRDRAVIIPAAVGGTAGRTTFYTRADRPYLGSIYPDSGRRAVKVPRVSFADLLAQYRPTIVKCDIEFGEYELPELRALPDHVRVLAMEVHIRFVGIFERAQGDQRIRDARQRAADLIAAVEAQGFREVRRKDKQARPTEAPIRDDTGLPPLTKAVDAIWVRP